MPTVGTGVRRGYIQFFDGRRTIRGREIMYTKLQAALKQAIREKDEITKMAIRNIKVKIERKQQEKILREKPEDVATAKKNRPSNRMVIAAIRKEAKELSVAVEELPKACSLVKEYKEQLDVCLELLPAIGSDEKTIAAAVDVAIEELTGVEAKNNVIKAGMVIGHVMRNNENFPGSVVKRLTFMKVGKNE